MLAPHEAYLEVERGERRGEVGEGGGEPETAAYHPDQPGAKRVVRDEEDPAPELAARDGLRDVVEGGGQPETLQAVTADAGSEPGLLQLALHAPHDLEGVLESVEVVVRALLYTPRERELRDGFQEPADVERRPYRLRQVQEGYRFRRAFLRLVFGLGRPLSWPEDSASSPVAEGLPALPPRLISAMRRRRLRSMYA